MKVADQLQNLSSSANMINTGKSDQTENKHTFGDILKKAVGEVNQLQAEANNAVEKVAEGKEIDIHNTMIALEKAGVSFQLMMQLRNKTLEAYQEVMRMQV